MRQFMLGVALGMSVSAGLVWAQWDTQAADQRRQMDEQINTLEQMRTLQQLEYNQRHQPGGPYSRQNPC